MRVRRILGIAALVVAAALTAWAGCGTVGSDWPATGEPPDQAVDSGGGPGLDAAGGLDAAPADTGMVADLGGPDVPAGEDDVVAALDVAPDLGGGEPDVQPDTGNPPLPPGVTGCVFCHTNKDTLLALAPEDPEPHEETGGG